MGRAEGWVKGIEEDPSRAPVPSPPRQDRYPQLRKRKDIVKRLCRGSIRKQPL